MRLIDADKLQADFKELRKSGSWCSMDIDILDIVEEDIIDTQSTAYDVKKVVEQLEEHSYIETVSDLDPYWDVQTKVVTLERAIEIVKGGGKV
jgi:hypothetical protein